MITHQPLNQIQITTCIHKRKHQQAYTNTHDQNIYACKRARIPKHTHTTTHTYASSHIHTHTTTHITNTPTSTTTHNTPNAYINTYINVVLELSIHWMPPHPPSPPIPRVSVSWLIHCFDTAIFT